MLTLSMPSLFFLVLLGVAAPGEPSPGRLDERLVPPDLTAKQKTALIDFVANVKKPEQFIPPTARVIGAGSVSLDPNPVPKAEIKEYLASIVANRPSAAGKTPGKAEVYWYRPNPKKGLPGVTVRRTVNLDTGAEIGEPEVLFNHNTPLAREEMASAVQLARGKNTALGDFLRGAETGDIEVTPLTQTIKVAGVPDGSPGDRVVTLQFYRKSTGERMSLNVNLTRETVRESGAP